MVVLTPRFTLLAALSSLAAVSAFPTPADGAALLLARDSDTTSSASAHHHTMHSHDFTSTASADAPSSTSTDDGSDAKNQRQHKPVIPLPSSMAADKSIQQSSSDDQSKAEQHKSSTDADDKSKRFIWDPVSPLLQLGPDIWVGAASRMRDGDRPIWSRRYDHHDKVIVKGDHDHVNVHRALPASRLVSRSNVVHVAGVVGPDVGPLPRDRMAISGNNDHVHLHGTDGHDKIVMKGSDDHVHVHRSPHDHHEEVIVKGDHDHVNVHRRGESPFSNYVSGEHGESYLVAHTKRSDVQIPGVPGSIDIISPVVNSTTGQKIASLVLSSPGNSTTSADNNTFASFVLNASGTDQTQVYLVATDPDSSNSTAPSNSTWANSTSSDVASFVKVALQIPMFDEEDAMLKPFCATFDPNPPAPSPLTVEMCMNGASADAHKSQVFAYEPGTGVIRPMWFNAQDDGMTDSNSTSATNSTSSATPSSSASVANSTTTAANSTMDPTTPTSDKVASITSLDEQFGDATRPPLRAEFAKTFDAPSIFAAAAQNVTLVFTPAAPEVVPMKSVDEPDSSDPSSVSATVSSTSTASVSSTSVASVPASLTASVTNPTSAATMTASVTDSSSTVSSTATASTSPSSSASNSNTSVASLPTGAKFASLSQATTAPDSTATAATGTMSSMSLSTATTSTSSATADPSLAVEVYDPAAASSAATASQSASSSSIGSSAAVSTVTVSVTASGMTGAQDYIMATTTMDSNSTVATTTVMESAASSTMTPVSTAPYEWMFRQGTIQEAQD